MFHRCLPWSATCFVTRKGYRKRGITYALAAATAEFAREQGARALEAYPMILKLRGPVHKDTRTCTQVLVDLYTAWDAAEPEKGHDVSKAEWATKLAQFDGASAQPPPRQ